MQKRLKSIICSVAFFASAVAFGQERFLPHLEVVFEGRSYPMFAAKNSKHVYFKTDVGEVVIVDDFNKFKFISDPNFYFLLKEGEHYEIIKDTKEILLDVDKLPKNRKVKIKI
jgi:hypothetical protein